MNPLLVGMNNPYGADPKYALYPHPPLSAGGRFYALVEEAVGLSRGEYVKRFDRINVVDGPWSMQLARKRAPLLMVMVQDYRQVILLGRDVQNAFGMHDIAPMHERSVIVRLVPRIETTFYCIPHPSGRNQWYNDPANRGSVIELIRRLLSDGVSQ